MPFIDQIIDACAESEIFFSWIYFLDTIISKFTWKTSTKLLLSILGELFPIRRIISFGLNNVGATFQWDIPCTLHGIKHIVESYLDDLDN